MSLSNVIVSVCAGTGVSVVDSVHILLRELKGCTCITVRECASTPFCYRCTVDDECKDILRRLSAIQGFTVEDTTEDNVSNGITEQLKQRCKEHKDTGVVRIEVFNPTRGGIAKLVELLVHNLMGCELVGRKVELSSTLVCRMDAICLRLFKQLAECMPILVKSEEDITIASEKKSGLDDEFFTEFKKIMITLGCIPCTTAARSQRVYNAALNAIREFLTEYGIEYNPDSLSTEDERKAIYEAVFSEYATDGDWKVWSAISASASSKFHTELPIYRATKYVLEGCPAWYMHTLAKYYPCKLWIKLLHPGAVITEDSLGRLSAVEIDNVYYKVPSEIGL